MNDPDLFSAAEDDAPHFCRECGYCLTDMHGPGHYCDLSKQDVKPDASACGKFTENGRMA
jgi:hypothetical protein